MGITTHKTIKRALLVLLVIASVYSCKKETASKTEPDNLTGKLKVINIHDTDSAGNRKYILLYDKSGFLYEIKYGDTDSIMYSITKETDSTMLVISPPNILLSFRVYFSGNTILKINRVDSTGYETIYERFNRIDTVLQSVEFIYPPTAGILDYYYIRLVRNDSVYAQSTLNYIVAPPAIGNLYTIDYTYTTFPNNGNIPYQFPYEGVDDDIGSEVLSGVITVEYIANINGYYGFEPNKYLINTANDKPYTYSFNSKGQVIALSSLYLQSRNLRLTLEYY